MSFKKTLIKNSSLNLLGYFYLLVTSFFSIPLMLKYLGANIFGQYFIYASLIPIAATLDLGLQTASIRFLSLPDNKKTTNQQYWQTSFFLQLVIGILLFIFSFLFINLVINQLTSLLSLSTATRFYLSLIISFMIFTNHIMQHFLVLPQVDQRFDIYNLRTLLVGTGNTILTAWLARYTSYLPHLFLFQFAMYFFTLFTLFSYAWKRQTPQGFYPLINRQISKKLINFGLKNFLGRLASQIRHQFSKYALGGMLSAQAVTIFSIPQNIIIKGAGAISQLTLSFFPMSAALSNKQRINKLKKLIISIQLLILFLGISQLFLIKHLGFQFLLWWLKDIEIAKPAFTILKILSWFFLTTSLTPIPTAVLDGLNYPHIPSFFATFSTILNIILIIYLTPQYQALGPAYATVISSFIAAPAFLVCFAIVFNKYCQKISSS